MDDAKVEHIFLTGPQALAFIAFGDVNDFSPYLGRTWERAERQRRLEAGGLVEAFETYCHKIEAARDPAWRRAQSPPLGPADLPAASGDERRAWELTEAVVDERDKKISHAAERLAALAARGQVRVLGVRAGTQQVGEIPAIEFATGAVHLDGTELMLCLRARFDQEIGKPLWENLTIEAGSLQASITGGQPHSLVVGLPDPDAIPKTPEQTYAENVAKLSRDDLQSLMNKRHGWRAEEFRDYHRVNGPNGGRPGRSMKRAG